MSLFKNKCRIESARWQNWNYANAGAYFVTICTKDRHHFFGVCDNDEMHLNEIGRMAWNFWNEIPKHFPQVQLDEFVVMPNHIHGIIIINPPTVETLHCNVSTTPNECNLSTDQNNCTEPSLNIGNDNINHKMSELSPKSGSLSTIIRSFKSVCSKHIRIQFPNTVFAWQSRFHDRVICNELEYDRIANYIINNPKNWQNDDFYDSSP